MRVGNTIAIFLLLLLCGSSLAQSSVLSEGQWFKLAIEKEGVYRIDRALLSRMGVDVSRVDPRKISIFRGHQGMLPQRNSAERTQDLQEISIHIQGEADGVFNNSDYILFYAQGPDKVFYDASRDIYSYQKNIYSRKNYYYLRVGSQNGKRVAVADAPSDAEQVIDQFEGYRFYEKDISNVLTSGRDWYGEEFNNITTHNFTFDLNNIIPGTAIKLVSNVMAQSYAMSSFRVLLNNVEVAEQSILPVSNFRYAIKGRVAVDTIVVQANAVNATASQTQTVSLQYQRNNSGLSKGFLDYLLIQARQRLQLNNDQLVFCSAQSTSQNTSTYVITTADANISIWDISKDDAITSQTFSIQNQQARFHAHSDQLKTYIAFRNSNVPAPEFIERIANQNIRASQTPELIIVSHPKLMQEAQRLAALRESQGMHVLTVSTTQVFNEFSGGKPDVTAIRDFVRHLYQKSPSTLKNLLLFGKGSYDYLDILNRDLNLVPTYMSRNSLHPLETYSSDDYFTFLENHEGNWGESPAENHTMDIGVGRIPAKTLAEARSVVDKLYAYAQPETFGSWRKEILFVADDGDFNIHQSQADQLASGIELNFPEFNTQKVYVDAFPQVVRPSGKVSPETTVALTKAIEEGVLIVNYTGHGNEQLWADERILDALILTNLRNTHFPLFVTATCEFGRHDNPTEISGGELSLLYENRGAIGLVTTARPVSSSTNFELNKAFYDAVFARENRSPLTLGEIFRRTKNNSLSGVANRNFSLLGDPSMRLAIPEQQIVLTEISNSTGTDTIRALSTVNVKGKVLNHSGEHLNQYQGILEVTVFDKASKNATLGNNNPVFNYEKFNYRIFKGQASVKDGEFSFEFVTPKNIAYQPGKGKIALYAYSDMAGQDAAGAEKDVWIGLSETMADTDNTAPQIKLYMGDPSFTDGGFVPSDTWLVARITDNKGINISAYGLGNTMSAQLNDGEPFAVNNHFIADVDGPRKGWLRYPLKNLGPGKHFITLRVWDVFNNPAVASIEFQVGKANEMIIEKFLPYPNPVKIGQPARLEFSHNRSGQDLEARLLILNSMGKEISSYTFDVPNSGYKVSLADFLPGSESAEMEKLSAGLYLFKLYVRSLADGAKTESSARLIVIN